MRYWVLQDDQVSGPFSLEELKGLPHFEAKSLVHPEVQSGLERAGGWLRAGSIPHLAGLFPEGERLPDEGAGLSPGQSLVELPALGGLVHKVEDIEKILMRMQMDSDRRDDDIRSLMRALRAKDWGSPKLRKAVEALSGRMGELDELRGELSRLRETQERKAGLLEELRDRIGALREEVDAGRRERADLSERLERLEAAPRQPVREHRDRSGLAAAVAALFILGLLAASLFYLMKAEPLAPPPAPLPAPPPPVEIPAPPEPAPPPPEPVKPPPKRVKKRAARKRARRKPPKKRQLTAAEKDARVKRQIMNRMRLRISGGRLSEGQKTSGEPRPAAGEPR